MTTTHMAGLGLTSGRGWCHSHWYYHIVLLCHPTTTTTTTSVTPVWCERRDQTGSRARVEDYRATGRTPRHRESSLHLQTLSWRNKPTPTCSLLTLHTSHHSTAAFNQWLLAPTLSPMWQHNWQIFTLNRNVVELFVSLSLQAWRSLIVLNIYLPKSSSSHSLGPGSPK